MERTPDEQWVMARLDAVAPTWAPTVSPARLREPSAGWKGNRLLPFGIATAAAALLVVLALTVPVRTVAQEFWYRIAVSRIDVVRLDFGNVPLDTSVRTDAAQTTVRDVEEAAKRAGFRPMLPPSNLVAHAPVLSVTSRIDVTQRLRTADLRDALTRVGAVDLDVPEPWNGAELRATIGPLVIADYANDLSIVQAAPIQLHVPAGIDLARVAEVVFRAAGSSWWEARLLGEAYATSPAWLLDVPESDRAVVEALPMADGTPGIVIDEYADDGRLTSTVVLSGPRRIVAVSSPSRAMSVQMAEAVGH